MVLKLYGSDLSTMTPVVALVLHELNVPFEYIQVHMLRDEHKHPEFVAKQPFVFVPYIVSAFSAALPFLSNITPITKGR